MPIYAVEYAETKSGRSHTTRVEAGNPQAAADIVRARVRDALVGEVRDITPASTPAAPPSAAPDWSQLTAALRADKKLWRKLHNTIALGVAAASVVLCIFIVLLIVLLAYFDSIRPLYRGYYTESDLRQPR